eukprot:10795334-Heterocapsa_arctica.AAC.1
MIYDKRVCYMPQGIARRLVAGTSASAINEAQGASKKLSYLLRHGDRRIEPFDGGGWFRCSDLFTPTGKKDLVPLQRCVEFLYNVVCDNDKQRFQLAFHTINQGGVREVTRIYATRCTS